MKVDCSELIKWAKKQILEAEGNWETEKYHQGYKDALNDLIRFLNNSDILEPIHWVSCEVISTVGYHDVHEVGDVIQVDREHFDEMIEKGFVRTIGCDYV